MKPAVARQNAPFDPVLPIGSLVVAAAAVADTIGAATVASQVAVFGQPSSAAVEVVVVRGGGDQLWDAVFVLFSSIELLVDPV